jgi:hypothetical protein
MPIVRTALLTVAGGLLIALVLFALTAPTARFLCCSPNVFVTKQGGVDQWTGEVRPMTLSVYDGTGKNPVTEVDDLSELAPPIPLRTGFVVGSLLTLTVIAINARRPRRTAPNPVVPAA